ncbi:unnamed protein product [Urochloa humidicola]
MDIWITQFGVRTRKLRVPEVAGKTCRPVGLGGPPNAPKLCTMALGSHQWASMQGWTMMDKFKTERLHMDHPRPFGRNYHNRHGTGHNRHHQSIMTVHKKGGGKWTKSQANRPREAGRPASEAVSPHLLRGGYSGSWSDGYA